MSDCEKGQGIFSKWPKMTPENVRRWFGLMRAELGWTVAEAAARAEIDAEDVEMIERTGETEELACEVRHLASVYSRAMFGDGGWTLAWMDRVPLARFGDMLHLAAFEVAGLLRRQRATLGLTLEEVVAALEAKDHYFAEQYPSIEWGQNIDTGDGFETIGRVLQLPAVEILRLNGDFSTEDLDEWFAWNQARNSTAPRAVA